MHIAIVKFDGLIGRAGEEKPGELWKAELVGQGGLRLPCRTQNYNARGYLHEESARNDARPYAELTGWPVIMEDETAESARAALARKQLKLSPRVLAAYQVMAERVKRGCK